jgi:hypothetical protein
MQSDLPFERQVIERSSYFALRVCPRADAEAWWSAARRRHDAPPAVAALLAGRARIELTLEEADQALAWAAQLDGWRESSTKPLTVYPTTALGERRRGEAAG